MLLKPMDQSKPTSPKVAIVHDWLVGGGAERVVLELHHMYPDAPIYTSYCTDEWQQKLDGKVITGYLQRRPFSRLRKFLPVLRGRWFEKLDLSQFDLVISSTGNGEAKAVNVRNNATHVCYCHTPTHFYWRHYDQYLTNPGFGLFNPLVRLSLRLLVGPLRRRDLRYSQHPQHYIANSTHIQADIKKYYDRESTIIFPPVDIERFASVDRPAPASATRHGFVTVGRQVPQKRTDIIVAACTQLGLPLTVLGRGPEHDRLVRAAGPTITFQTDATDEEVTHALASAEAFIFAALDDFGITPVEAMAAGTPVIAYKGGGALDYVLPGVSGEFFAEQTVESLVSCLQSFNTASYNPDTLRRHASQFSSSNFQSRLKAFLDSLQT